MFRETTVHKLQPFTLIFCVPFPACWTLAITFILLLLTTNNITSFFVPLSVKASWSTTVLKNFILQTPLSLICQTNLWIESVSGMDGAWWMLSGSNISSDLGKYTIIIDSTSFMAASENSLGVWATIWPEFTFQKMMFVMIPPTSSIGTLPWCTSL